VSHFVSVPIHLHVTNVHLIEKPNYECEFRATRPDCVEFYIQWFRSKLLNDTNPTESEHRTQLDRVAPGLSELARPVQQSAIGHQPSRLRAISIKLTLRLLASDWSTVPKLGS
jgi:hypothetical protein